jgi:hypothetical protein
MQVEFGAMTKQELLLNICTTRRALEMTLSRLTHDQMLLPGVDGEWSVKDALAHISAWERNMIRWTSSLLAGHKPDTPDPWDVERINADIFARVKDIPLASVLEEFRESHQAAFSLAKSLTEDQLQTRHPDTWPMERLWVGIAANMNFHYKDHCRDIEGWMERNHS